MHQPLLDSLPLQPIEVRPPATQCATRRQEAPRCGLSADQWHAAVPLADLDQDGNVLDILVQHRRSKATAKKLFRKLLEGCQYVPRVIIIDKLGGYAAVHKDVMPSVAPRQHKRLNNHVENSHQPTHQRERTLQRFKSPGYAQRFLSACGPIREHFCPHRHRLRAEAYHRERARRFLAWTEETGPKMAA
jgi:putative transposase